MRPRLLPLACLATIAAADYVIQRHEPSWFAIGPLDHAAHLATALLIAPRRGRAAFLAGSVLPDVDHIPLAFQDPQPGDPRPKTHSLPVVAGVAAVSRPAAAGMLTHLVRDLALDPGVPLFGGRDVRVPYVAYAAGLIGIAVARSPRD